MQHPDAHVLERHGHDVIDEALITRATTGIAPDDFTVKKISKLTKPPYSSKFESPQQVRQALTNTRPNTPAFNSAPITNGRKVVVHELANGATYGKGVQRDGNTFLQSTKVRAVYENKNGSLQLITMYPDF